MKPRSRRTLVGLLIVAALALGLWAYEYVIGFPRCVDGQWVQRHTDWHAPLGYQLPMPYQRGVIYYYYVDAEGNVVKHGLFRTLHWNGTVEGLGFYRHGKRDGKWTTWDAEGIIRSEAIWKDGRRLKFDSFPKIVEDRSRVKP